MVWNEIPYDHITLEFHQVHPKWFLSLWYVCRKPYNYLPPTLKLSPNGPKWDSTWPTSPSSSIGVHPKWFMSQWYIWRKTCTCLASTLLLSQNALRVPLYLNVPNWDSINPRYLVVSSCASKIISEPVVCLAQTVHLSSTNTNTVTEPTKL
jgi:hypothetical protein